MCKLASSKFVVALFALLFVFGSSIQARAQAYTVSGQITDTAGVGLSGTDSPHAGLMIYRSDESGRAVFVNQSDCWGTGEGCPDWNGQFSFAHDYLGNDLPPVRYNKITWADFFLVKEGKIRVNAPKKIELEGNPLLLDNLSSYCYFASDQMVCAIYLNRKGAGTPGLEVVKITVSAELGGPNQTSLTDTEKDLKSQDVFLDTWAEVWFVVNIPPGAPKGYDYSLNVRAGQNDWRLYRTMSVFALNPLLE